MQVKSLVLSLATILLAMLGLAQPAHAAKQGFEVDGGATIFVDTATFGITGRGAYVLPVLGPFFVAPEVEGSIGLFGQDDGLEVDRTIAGFARGGFSLGDKVDLHGRVGFQSAKISLDSGAFEISATDGDFAWGVGATYWVRDRIGIRGDYTRSDGLDQIGITAAFRF